MKILVPVDGSETSARAVQFMVKQVQNSKEIPELHLLNVQHALPGNIKGVADQAKQYHHDEGIKALKESRFTYTPPAFGVYDCARAIVSVTFANPLCCSSGSAVVATSTSDRAEA